MTRVREITVSRPPPGYLGRYFLPESLVITNSQAPQSQLRQSQLRQSQLRQSRLSQSRLLSKLTNPMPTISKPANPKLTIPNPTISKPETIKDDRSQSRKGSKPEKLKAGNNTVLSQSQRSEVTIGSTGAAIQADSEIPSLLRRPVNRVVRLK